MRSSLLIVAPRPHTVGFQPARVRWDVRPRHCPCGSPRRSLHFPIRNDRRRARHRGAQVGGDRLCAERQSQEVGARGEARARGCGASPREPICRAAGDPADGVLQMLSGINGAVVRISNRDELLHETCRLAHRVGGYAVAMVALIDPTTRMARPVGWAGYEFLARPDEEFPVADHEAAIPVSWDVSSAPARPRFARISPSPPW